MRSLKLMADYECHPLWEASSDEIGNVDPETLPISSALKADLLAWAETYDATLNRSDPIKSGFSEKEDRTRFMRQGENLRQRLSSELGPGYAISLQP